MRGTGVEIDPAIIQRCVDQSGGSDERSGANNLLDAELERQNALGIFIIPTILINGVTYRGNIKCPPNAVGSISWVTCGVLSEICLGFANVSAVPACMSPQDCKLGLQKDALCNVCGGVGLDKCGTCAQPKDANYNRACAGCDGVPNSGRKFDSCGVCAGPGRDACGNCPGDYTKRVNDSSVPGACQPASKQTGSTDNTATVSPGIVVVIVVVLIAVVGVAVWFYMRHRQLALKQDIDSLLKQYLPMGETSDAKGGL